MKNIYKALKIFLSIAPYWCIVLAVSMISCEDALIEEPKRVATAQFYQTSEEMQTGVFAIYSALNGSNRAEMHAVLDYHSEFVYGRGSRANYNDFAGFNSGNVNVAEGRWNMLYSGIRNANIIIANAANATEIDPSDVDAFIGEAKFLRAWAYFDLVRNWAGVPLRTDQNMDERDIPRSSVDDVYDLIMDDLMEAESTLPEDPENAGRATRYAAKTLLADVYLTLGMYDEARDKANEVITSNKFSLVPVSSFEDFQWDVFGPTIVTSTEEIFYMKRTRLDGFGNWMLFIINHPSTGNFNFGGAYASYSDATNPFYVNWDDNDIRKALWDNIDFGLGPNTLVSKKFIDPEAASRTGAGNDIPIYRYPDALLIYAEASSQANGGPTAAGMEALNMVHRRAYGHDPNTPSVDDYVLTDYDQASFLDLVLTERAYEFQMEGKRWLDLKRTGKAAAVILATRGITIAEKHYLWPIPVNEIELNKAFTGENQNPGY
ncbi:MAG: RagB/SusD family nutrient uptake outer membrane protein [Cyclobacteriaceae bacterium]